MNKVLIAALLGLSMPALGQSLLRVYNFQWTDSRSCDAHAAAFAQNITDKAGVQVELAMCEYVDATDRTNLVFKINSDTSIRKVSTSSASTYDPRGFYATRASCEKYLQWERNVFKQQTGLEALVSFCAKESASRHRPWYAHLVGIGEPQKIPVSSSWYSSIPHAPKRSEIFTKMKARLASHGFLLTHAAFRNRGLGGGTTVQMYGPTGRFRPSFRSELLVTVDGLAQCSQVNAQMERRAESQENFKYITSYCASPYSNPRHFDLTVAYLPGGYSKIEYSHQTFSSLQDCQNNTKSLLERMNIINEGFIPVTYVCGARPFSGEAWKNIFRLAVLYKRNS